jgi:Rps23 Pro-64 3,4-dihydroxylase Tpa1-like proline 4-hydroxylase
MKIDLNQKYHVIDNFLDENTFNELLKMSENGSYTSGWKSSKKTDPHGHWNINFAKGGGAANLADVTYMLNEKLFNTWKSVKQKYGLEDMKLLRCYINAHTYGVEGYTHKDSSRDDEWTVVLYLIDDWKVDWAGETIVVEDGEIVKSVIPKRNRALIFPGNHIHAARAVSRICYGLRRTLMFKFRAPRCADFERLSEFLVSKGANKHKHSKGSLHDHLMRNFALLKDRGSDLELCNAAGLHSIFGTNAFSKCVLREDDYAELAEKFSERAATLARLFSSIQRPKTLELPEHLTESEATVELRDGNGVMTIPRFVFDELRLMEAANLYDQKSLKAKKYPTLVEIWNDSNSEEDKEDEFD